jgi:hypothetical protein
MYEDVVGRQHPLLGLDELDHVAQEIRIAEVQVLVAADLLDIVVRTIIRVGSP